eukprot:CAMPEP_0182437488 /NCGR_PEP_ID=MMETSP1167-20130531/85077_1 /TAXON_ID=2988 /ORGANISM="Mallomonas Sp, Strain CCMP3275" /LENGTH=198 /DNA_ID=CAMNT_0024630427 /DNA_START=267 /DNA_END=867 /DNA_ORIENTATION=-
MTGYGYQPVENRMEMIGGGMGYPMTPMGQHGIPVNMGVNMGMQHMQDHSHLQMQMGYPVYNDGSYMSPGMHMGEMIYPPYMGGSPSFVPMVLPNNMGMTMQVPPNAGQVMMNMNGYGPIPPQYTTDTNITTPDARAMPAASSPNTSPGMFYQGSPSSSLSLSHMSPIQSPPGETLSPVGYKIKGEEEEVEKEVEEEES